MKSRFSSLSHDANDSMPHTPDIQDRVFEKIISFLLKHFAFFHLMEYNMAFISPGQRIAGGHFRLPTVHLDGCHLNAPSPAVVH